MTDVNPALSVLTGATSAGSASDSIQSLRPARVAWQWAARVVMLTSISVTLVWLVTISMILRVLALNVQKVAAIATLAILTSADARLVVLAIDWICSLAAASLAPHLIASRAAMIRTDVIRAKKVSCSTRWTVSALHVLYLVARVASKTTPCVTRASGHTTGHKWMVE